MVDMTHIRENIKIKGQKEVSIDYKYNTIP